MGNINFLEMKLSDVAKWLEHFNMVNVRRLL
jgi:hypothetical protein